MNKNIINIPFQYGFYSKNDTDKEVIGIIGKTIALSRYNAAVYFAQVKQLPLKDFLKLFSVTR